MEEVWDVGETEVGKGEVDRGDVVGGQVGDRVMKKTWEERKERRVEEWREMGKVEKEKWGRDVRSRGGREEVVVDEQEVGEEEEGEGEVVEEVGKGGVDE